MFCRKRTAPQLKRVRVLSVRTETTEGGVVVRDRAHVSGKLVKRPAVATGGKQTCGGAAPPARRATEPDGQSVV